MRGILLELMAVVTHLGLCVCSQVEGAERQVERMVLRLRPLGHQDTPLGYRAGGTSPPGQVGTTRQVALAEWHVYKNSSMSVRTRPTTAGGAA